VAVWTVKCMSTDSSLYIFRQPFTECLSCLTLHTCVITTVDVTIHLLHRITWRRSDNEQIYIYIYIYIKTHSVKRTEGRVVNILQKGKKVREGGGQRAESDRTKMNICLCHWFAYIKTLWQNFRSFLSKDFPGFFCLHYNNNSHLFNDLYTGKIFLLHI